MQLETIIGLEIHAQVNTKSKFFCSCDNDSFGKIPNTNVCPVCMGFPGQLPVPNESVIQKGIAAGLALGCHINEKSFFDRKQYYYPDLPSGYQITQNDIPIAVKGAVSLRTTEEGARPEFVVNITRMHLENDAGKLTHISQGTLCDYNRSGTPLMEIVSEPDLRSPVEARLYAEQIQNILRYVGASDCDMEKGMMRFDASVSIRPVGAKPEEYPNFFVHPVHGVLFPRVEIKNLNSFRSLEAALKYEIARLTELIEMGEPLKKEQTVGWIDDEKVTKLLREKESSADYRYFQEPDIPPIVLTQEEIEAIRAQLPELPAQRFDRYISEYALFEKEAIFLVSDKPFADFFEEVVTQSKDLKASVSWVLSALPALLKEKQETVHTLKFSATDLAHLIALVGSGEISGKIAKDVFPIMYETGAKPSAIIEEKGWKQVSDTGLIEKVVTEVLAANPQSIVDYQAGKDKALAFLVGQVMKETKGQANPGMVNEIILQLINK